MTLVKDHHKFKSNKEILSYLNNMEVNLTQDKVLFFGVNFWPVIRLHIAFSLIQKNQKIEKLKNSVLDQSIISKNHASIKEGKTQLLITHDNFFIEIEGKKYDRVLEKIKKNSSSPIVFNLANNSFYLNNYDEPFKNISKQIFFIKVLSFFLGVLLNVIKISKFRSLEKLQIIDPEVSKPVVKGRKMAIRICYIFLLSKYLNYLFRELNIKHIYQAMYYDNFGLASGLTSHNLGLVNNCVQHGGQSENNPAFGSWKVMSNDGYEVLPDYFLCWDEASSKSIDLWSSLTSKHSSKLIGYGWMELWKTELNDKFNLSSNTLNQYPNVLITLQPSVKLKESFISSFIQSSELKVNWILRLHPRQDSPTFLLSLKKYFSDSENIYIKSSKEPLPFLMTNSILHVTFFSSSVYEAKYCNLKSVIIDERGLDYFPELIENGDAEIALESQKLKEIIQKAIYDDQK